MLLELNKVTRLYGTVIGVNDISLELPEGAHGLLGPNGAGKTTLLNLLTGQLSPTLGSLRVLGQQTRRNAKYFKRIGYLPGIEGMYADVSAIEWVTYLTRIQGFSRKQAYERSVNALKQVELSEHQDRKISTYSRGMRQRARLAQAIAHEPEFLILDEPFSGLDPIARHSMTTFLQKWIADGRNLLISSHVLYEIESLTRSFLLLSGGRLLAAGSTDDITPLLGNSPTDVFLRCNDPRALAAELLVMELTDRISFTNRGELQLSTTNALKLNEYLAKAAIEGRYLVHEFRSSDDSLQDVFDSLMKSHRGVA